MKILLSFILTITTTLSFGQYTKTEKTTQTIVQQRSIYLNGGARASVGGKSRVVIPFDLPQNTVEWYYSFSTSAGTPLVRVSKLVPTSREFPNSKYKMLSA